MGSGIAAHLANLGFQVTLLDQSRESCESGFERAKGARPPHFFVPETAQRIQLGAVSEHAESIQQADWICEAIIERLDAKRALFAQVEPLLKESAAITTNTSGLEIALLAEGRSESFRHRFLGTHFFNPPRYLKLLELIPTQDTRPEAVSAMSQFLENRVARRVIVAKDTPGFIANRFGMWSMFQGTHTAEKLYLSVEQVDAMTGAFIGRPRTGTFRLNDLVGLDIMVDIAKNLRERCVDDPHLATLDTPTTVSQLMSRGWLGDKSGQGYYRREGRELVAYDMETQAYRQRLEVSFPSIEALMKLPLAERLRQGLELRDEVGEYLRAHILPILDYAHYLKQEISHSVLDFDRVMQWGFGWEMGPFGMRDALGLDEKPNYADGCQRDFEGSYVSLPAEPQFRSITDFPVEASFETFNVRQMDDGVKALAISTKQGSITPQLLREMNQFLDEHTGPLVLTSESKHFSVGFDLRFFLEKIEAGTLEDIDHALKLLQDTAVRLSTLPIVSAVFGYTLGAGLELAFQCPVMAIDSEAKLGFPEVRVGLLPGGGGTAEMALRGTFAGAKGLVEHAKHLIQGSVTENADQGRAMSYVRKTDVTVYLRERLLSEAASLAASLTVPERAPWRPVEGPVSGMIDRLVDEMAKKDALTDHDLLIAEKIRLVMSKSTSFAGALEAERTHFVDLCPRALNRVKHMLETGKPLRD